ncbi:MAG TPA: cytochrome P450 [Acidimicrobiales bacterium]|jgi:cytochrome P450|nr:cytochrome P450 [Acidimicrobiales bacterium]
MATRVDELDLPELDVTRADERDVRLAEFERVRAEHWLARGPFGYVLTNYEDIVAILRDRRFHSAANLIAEMQGVTDPQYFARRRTSILTAEGEVHARLRRLVAPAFTPKAADRLRPFIRDVIEQLVDEISPRGRCELVADVCEPYPIPIICELLGAPAEDWQLFSRWATEIFRIFDANLADDLPVIMKAQDELDEYVRQLIDSRRGSPRDDLLSDLIRAEEAGDRLSTEELVMMAEAILLGGTDTTRNQLACAVALFTGYPDQWALLAERPELAGRAVEESMRYIGAIRGTGRFASEDIEYRNVLFPTGTLVFPSLLAGNFDGEVWQEPERFDITLERETLHLTFGSGIHFCLGAWLARAELQEALPVLARRLPDLAVDGAITWKANTAGIWGPVSLPLRFTPTPARLASGQTA